MAKQVKCPVCGKRNDKQNTMQINNRYYCLNCGQEKQEKTKRNKDGWEDLFHYICDLYGIKILTGMMFKQIKDFRNEPYNYTNAGMLLTLKYYYEILGNELKDDVGLGIIPYYYEKAKKQYMEVAGVKMYMNEFELTEKENTVKILYEKDTTTVDKIKRRNQLPLESICWEEE